MLQQMHAMSCVPIKVSNSVCPNVHFCVADFIRKALLWETLPTVLGGRLSRAVFFIIVERVAIAVLLGVIRNEINVPNVNSFVT